jgi:opacity protein-like surface antigen
MKKVNSIWMFLSLCISLFYGVQPLFAQGYGGPLTFHGIDRYQLHSAGIRAMGGLTIGLRQDIGVMFHNPAALHSLQGIQISIGGLQRSEDIRQNQQYAPVRYYPNLSLLLEGLTDNIPNPDPSFFGFTAQDTVQRPYDDVGPNWSRSSDRSVPLQAQLAVPVSIGNVKFVAGIGAVEYADLNHYYQNNNVLSPSVLSQRPLPTFRPTDNNPIRVDWSQSIRFREGSVRGYGMALAGGIEKINLSFGISGMILNGSTDDYEQQVSRGLLTFFSNSFRADSAYSRITKIGTSDFSGGEFTLSGLLSGSFVRVGFSVKLPTTITRTYTMQAETDTTGVPTLSTLNGEDKLKLPFRSIIGLSISPRENLTLGLEYEIRPYASVRYTGSGGTEESPWLSASLLRVGIEYRLAPWLALRGGMRGESEVFEPEGNHIEGEPVTFTIYSAGVGIIFSGIRLNVAYENSLMKYQDIWGSAISKNSDRAHTIIANISYEISLMR